VIGIIFSKFSGVVRRKCEFKLNIRRSGVLHDVLKRRGRIYGMQGNAAKFGKVYDFYREICMTAQRSDGILRSKAFRFPTCGRRFIDSMTTPRDRPKACVLSAFYY
jgi:hypothetical protein